MNPVHQRAAFWVALLLSGFVVVLAFPVWNFGFLRFEDGPYVVDNPIVRHGCNRHSLKAAFTTAPEANWMPFTWVAMAAQTELAGPPPRAEIFRITSLLLHALSGCLLWLLLKSCHLRRICSLSFNGILAGVAAFLIHPQRVECVAWIASQKDLWATLWFVAATFCHLQTINPFSASRVAIREKIWRALAAVFFALSLLSKPSAVTSPLLMLWMELHRGTHWRVALRHTLPFCIMSLAVTLIAWHMNTTGEMLFDPGSFNLLQRLGKAFAVVAHHAVTFLCPLRLVPELAMPQPEWPWITGGIFIVLLILSGLLSRRFRPVSFPFCGWLILLLPVTGIIPTPILFTSDRMNHLPSLALSLAVAILITRITPHPSAVSGPYGKYCNFRVLGRFRVKPLLPTLLTIFTLIWWLHLARRQTACWKDDTTLFQHIVAIYPEHALARVNLGVLAIEQNDHTRALEQFQQATGGDRKLFSAWHHLCILQLHQKNLDGAITTARELVRNFPERAESWYFLGNVLREGHRLTDALEAYRKADSLRPDSLIILKSLITVLTDLGRNQEAGKILARIPSHLRHNSLSEN